ncbi:MAG: thermonuclease family protein [Clostridia bacterium]|nr:thermonuclease family protein [Clostridia bacterium]
MKKLAGSVVLAALAAVVYFFGGFSSVKTDTPQEISKTEIPARIAEVSKNDLAPNAYIEAEVTKVTDGDTLEVKYKGKTQKVRLLCVDTPESVKTNVQVQPYGKEASEYTKQKVLGKKVKLVFDKGLRDRYGRLLAYVIINDQYFLNADLVRAGYARVEIVSPNSSQSEYFKNLQQQAVKDQKGIWGLPEGQQPFVKGKNGNYVPRYWDEKKAS